MLEPRTTDALRGLRLIAENVGWILPDAHVCWIAERPVGVTFDISGRLHSSSGPALRYGDGCSVYAWKGTRVPRWVIDKPQRMSLNWIDAQIDSLVRHAMIDIFTPERFVESGGAQRLASDASGTIWFRKWSYRGAVIDSWAAIEFPVEGGTRSLRCIPTCLSTPKEALEWLFGYPRAAAERYRWPQDAHEEMYIRYDISSRALPASHELLSSQESGPLSSGTLRAPQAGRLMQRRRWRKDERVVPIATRQVDDRG
jgi:hypothetical protein